MRLERECESEECARLNAERATSVVLLVGTANRGREFWTGVRAMEALHAQSRAEQPHTPHSELEGLEGRYSWVS